jgi:hypothetical protein
LGLRFFCFSCWWVHLAFLAIRVIRVADLCVLLARILSNKEKTKRTKKNNERIMSGLQKIPLPAGAALVKKKRCAR